MNIKLLAFLLTLSLLLIGEFHLIIKTWLETSKNPFKKKLMYDLRSVERPDLTYRVDERDIVGLYHNVIENPKIKNKII